MSARLAPYTGDVCNFCGALLKTSDLGDTCANCQEESEQELAWMALVRPEASPFLEPRLMVFPSETSGDNR